MSITAETPAPEVGTRVQDRFETAYGTVTEVVPGGWSVWVDFEDLGLALAPTSTLIWEA